MCVSDETRLSEPEIRIRNVFPRFTFLGMADVAKHWK